MSKRKAVAVSVILILLTLVYLIYSRDEQVQRGNTQYWVVTRLDAGSNRSITILLDATPFELPAWYYEINEGREIVVPMTFLSGCCRPDVNPELRLLTSTDRNLVGMVWARRPEVLLFVHDFASGESWPRLPDNASLEARLQLGRHLRDRLQADNPQPTLALSYEVP